MPSDKTNDDAVYTTSGGLKSISGTIRGTKVGSNGPLLLQDYHHIDLLQHFHRERIPERVVHAKGSGALGYLEITHDISDICCAKLFNKIKTEEDPVKFPHFIHTQKRYPDSNLAHGDDPNMFWDYLSQNPESIHQVMILFGDRGVPDGYRGMNAYSGHTFKFVNKSGSFKYVQIHCLADQKRGDFLTQEESVKMAGESPDHSTKDLFDAIERKEFPSWTCYVQEMSAEQAQNFRYNILDLTKVWPHKEFPLRPFAKFTLNENPTKYVNLLSRSNRAIGVRAITSPTRSGTERRSVLQSRLFSYNDAHIYRIGINYTQLPINESISPVANFQRDGPMALGDNQGSRPNYKSTIRPMKYPTRHINFQVIMKLTELDFEPARALWSKVFDDKAKERFVKNVGGHLGNVSLDRIKKDQIAIFLAVDKDLGTRVAKEIGLKDLPEPYKPEPASQATKFAPNLKSSGQMIFDNTIPV
ncbi:hypothetical protein PSTT_10354 [Puccinia striiformis]|uniref:Catalase core domain-containing protein n=1 Tax=Puccinia striiformis TaxID=27350 RepID=A0A2S4V556_9BASI|nr:hypothetical protein PSTT_10354 [Puccinia striiformis]